MDSWSISFGAGFDGKTQFNGIPGDLLLLGSAKSLMNVEESRKRSQFLITPDCSNDYDDYFDDQLPEKKRRLTPDQVLLLEKSFEEENKLEPDRKIELSNKLGLPPRQVAVWFQNRRARWKTKQLEKDYDQLKASYESLLSNYDSLLNENLNLKSELMSLREKSQVKEVSGEDVKKFPAETLPAEIVPFPDAAAWGEDDGRQIIDSDESYFRENDFVAAVYYVNSEEDDGSDGYRSDMSNVKTGDEFEPLIWCNWT